MESLYASRYADLYRRHWWWRVRERILLTQIRRFSDSRSGTIRILDVGCGAGLFFDALSEFGDVLGIETDLAIAQQSGKWRKRIHVGSLETLAQGERFDLILMLDVLEHVASPEQILRDAVSRLTHDGCAIVTVPAFQWLWTSHDDLNHHIRRYTATELRSLLTDANLLPVDVRYLFQSLVVPKLLVRAREAVRRVRPAVPSIPPPLLNRLLQAWFRAEHVVAGRLPFGTSVMAVARVRR